MRVISSLIATVIESLIEVANTQAQAPQSRLSKPIQAKSRWKPARPHLQSNPKARQHFRAIAGLALLLQEPGRLMIVALLALLKRMRSCLCVTQNPDEQRGSPGAADRTLGTVIGPSPLFVEGGGKRKRDAAFRSNVRVDRQEWALRKQFAGSRWAFTETKNAVNPHSHCDIACAGARATEAHREHP
jgi:hypothetical protein